MSGVELSWTDPASATWTDPVIDRMLDFVEQSIRRDHGLDESTALALLNFTRDHERRLVALMDRLIPRSEDTA